MPKDCLKNKKIFVGFNWAGAAGIYSFTRVLRNKGYKIDFYGQQKVSFNMPVDFLLTYSGNTIISFWQRLIYFFKILFKYDIWHFNAMQTFFFYPLNLLILKIFQKKIICTFRGSETRSEFDFLPKTLYQKKDPCYWPSYYQNLIINRNFKKKIINWLRRTRINFFVAISDQVIINGPHLVSSVPRFDQIIPYSRTIGKIPENKKNKTKLIILHAPSNPEVKGTEYIQKTFKKLSKKYPQHQFLIPGRVPFEELQDLIARSDIIIDQLLVGWYGGIAVEAMALGKVVMSFMNPPYFAFVPFAKEIPVFNTNIWTFEKDLENILNLADLRTKLAGEGYKFAKKYHSSEKIATQYLEVYKKLC